MSFPEFSIISSQGPSLLSILQVSQHAMLLTLRQAGSPEGRALLWAPGTGEGSGFLLRAPCGPWVSSIAGWFASSGSQA